MVISPILIEESRYGFGIFFNTNNLLMKFFFLSSFIFGLILSSCYNSRDTSESKASHDSISVNNREVYFVADTFSIAGYDFVLKDGSGLSKLEVVGGSTEVIGKLELKSPSFIIREHQSKDLLFYSYPQFGVERIYMLAGTELDSLEKVERVIPLQESRTSAIQGLVFTNNKFYLTKAIDGVIRRNGYSSDEKDFYGLAELFAQEYQ